LGIRTASGAHCSTSYTSGGGRALRFQAKRLGKVIKANGERMTLVHSSNLRDDFKHEEPAELVRVLETRLEDLGQLVRAQQGLLQEQQKTIEQLQRSTSSAQRTSSGQVLTSENGWSLRTPSFQASRAVSPFDSQRIGIGDRRLLGLFDSRFHSTSSGATPKDFRVLPDRIFLVRHAESEGNVDNAAYTTKPDSQVPLTLLGRQQAQDAGLKIRQYIEDRSPDRDYKLFFYTSPYKRSLETYESMSACFSASHIRGLQEEVQLREQDFGNFQDAEGKEHEKAERLRFGRFFYRFPNGESGADVYDRITIFEDHMIRDINAGRFADRTNLVLVTHGLALRIFLMRWFHWTLDQYLMVHNPPNAEPLVLERIPNDSEAKPGGAVAWMHTKALYRLNPESMDILRGCTSDMCTTTLMPRLRQESLM
jgi:broad specificity phosphatase PhoE